MDLTPFSERSIQLAVHIQLLETESVEEFDLVVETATGLIIGTAITKTRWERLVEADATPTELLRVDNARWRVQHRAFPYGTLHLTDVYALTGKPPQPTYGGGRHMRALPVQPHPVVEADVGDTRPSHVALSHPADTTTHRTRSSCRPNILCRARV
ncbi:MAG: hypothetical protein ACK4UY_15080 [Dietzia sp.]